MIDFTAPHIYDKSSNILAGYNDESTLQCGCPEAPLIPKFTINYDRLGILLGIKRLFFLYYPRAHSPGERFGGREGIILIVADYFFSAPAKNAFYADVNRAIGVLYGWIYTCLLVGVRAVRNRVRTAQTFSTSELSFAWRQMRRFCSRSTINHVLQPSS